MLLSIFEDVEAGPTEEVKDLQSLIKERSEPFLEATDLPLWRGFKKASGIATIAGPRKDRKPLNSDNDVHDRLNAALEPVAGFKPRSSAMFCTGDQWAAGAYGREHLVFPVGDFRFLWSPYVRDAWGYLRSGFYDEANVPDGYHEMLAKALHTFSDDELGSDTKAVEMALRLLFDDVENWRSVKNFTTEKEVANALHYLDDKVRSELRLRVLEQNADAFFKTGENSTLDEAIRSENEIMLTCSNAILVDIIDLKFEGGITWEDFNKSLRD